MEEKERYVIRYDLDYNRCLIDTEKNQGVGDYIQIVKLLNQQSKRIKELENENQQLKQQLTITEKALELACERVKYFEEMQDREMGHFEFFGYDNEYDLQAIIEQYKQQALTHQHEDKGE